MEKGDKIFVAGHRGLVGSAIVRKLETEGFQNIITRTRQELDLLDQKAVAKFFMANRPEYIFLAAAKVGGIMANASKPAEFIFENLSIQSNIIHSAHLTGVKKLLFLGSSCIYPRLATQPMKEEYLMTGPLEPTNAAYAVAKIAGISLCQSYHRQYGSNFISVMPTNIYGPNDNFNPESSHVIPSLIRKFHEAKTKTSPTVTLWGTGKARREFLHVNDLADACLFLMRDYDKPDIINIGTGQDVTIKELAEMVKKITNYDGRILWDQTKPDGTPRKLLDVAKIQSLGWQHQVELETGLADTYQWFRQE